MPRVIVDFERLKNPHCGLGQFALRLGRCLPEQADRSVKLCYFVPQSQANSFAGLNVDIQYVRPWRREALLGPVRPLVSLAMRERADVWHVTHQQSKYLPVDSRVPVLLTIHDLNFLHGARPQKVARELKRIQQLVDRASIVTTISKFTAGEVREHLQLRGKPLHVIYNGALVDRAPAVEPAWLPTGKFLFTIGDIAPSKNFAVLVDLVRQLPEHRLVIAGNHSSGYAQEIIARVAREGLTDRVLLPGRISDGERAWLYEHCEALVFPSLAEGFGLPVVEAMTHGKPVFVARSTSLPEIAGPLGFFWDDFAPAAMADVFRRGMQVFSSDADYPAKLQAHAQQFTWHRAAADYLRLYQQLAAGTAKLRSSA